MQNSFIEFIDTYRQRTSIPSYQYPYLLQTIHTDYVENMAYGQCPTVTAAIHPTTSHVKIEPVEIIEKPKRKIILENIEIKTIQDLIDLAEKYPPPKKHEEYSVDIETIHLILPELRAIQQMIGMNSIKETLLDQLLYFMQKLHVKTKETADSDFKHTVIYGPPGTGKTEIAKHMGTMYSKIGAFSSVSNGGSNSKFKKVTRSDLVAGFLGQTAIKTQKVIDESLGGVLFIDEAYSLAPRGDSSSNDSFSKECIDTLCENMSAHKEDWMVIIAGYEEELKTTFFRSNIGLESRFLWRFKIDSYSPHELAQMYEKKVADQGWILEISVSKLEQFFKTRMNDFKHYGRDVESLFTYTKIAHGRKQFGHMDGDQIRHISIDNLNSGFQMFLNHRHEKTQEPPSVLFSMYL